MYKLFSVLIFPFMFQYSIRTIDFYINYWINGNYGGMVATFLVSLPCYCLLYDLLKNRSSNTVITFLVISSMFFWGLEAACPNNIEFLIFAATYPIAVFILVAEWITKKEAKNMMRFTSS